MENVATETKEAATQAPVTETNVAAPVTTETKQAVVPNTGEKKPDPKEFARQAFKERDDKRELKASERLKELEKELSDLKAKPKEAPVEPPSFLDDPDRWAKGVEERAEKRAVENFQRQLQEAQEQHNYRQQTESAADWLLTRNHSKQDPKFAQEVVDTVQKRLAHVAAVDPSVAMEMAYISVCKEKGITPDIEGFVAGNFDATKGNATGAKPSAPAGGKRVFARGEGRAYINQATPGTEEFSRRVAEVGEAEREGRVKR